MTSPNVSDSASFWSAELASRLDEVTIVSPLGPEAAGPTLDLIRRFGFAIVESPACALDPDSIQCRSEVLLDFGRALGTPLVQSTRRELVEDVKDYSDIETGDDRDVRGYRSGGELVAHSDPPTLVVLHCVQPAKSGGESSIVRVSSIVQRMAATAPELLDELFRPLPDWRVAGQNGISEAGPAAPRPVLARRDGILSCVLYRPYVELGAAARGEPLSPEQVAALDLFETCSMADDLTLRFLLQPGQTLIVHNRAVLHARCDYRDHAELERRRHLLRLWIDAPVALPVHPDHELGDIFAAAQAPRGCRAPV